MFSRAPGLPRLPAAAAKVAQAPKDRTADAADAKAHAEASSRSAVGAASAAAAAPLFLRIPSFPSAIEPTEGDATPTKAALQATIASRRRFLVPRQSPGWGFRKVRRAEVGIYVPTLVHVLL
jgi:hypothetical protein